MIPMPHPRHIEGYAIVFRGWHLENCLAVLIATTDRTGSRQLRELERALAQLPEDQRQIILLVGLEGMSYKDAAAILEVRDSPLAPVTRAQRTASGALIRNFTPKHSTDTPPPAMAA
jgi:hypothetical protein